MRKLFLFVIVAALLVTPALAAGEDAVSDPSVCAHSFEATELRKATCAEKGLVAYSCSKCGLTYTEETLPDGEHEYAPTGNTATCTEAGTITYVCVRCGDMYIEDAPAAGHVPEEQPASCTHSQICTVCGEVLVPATGHDYTYQYDAEKDEDGDFLSFGTWKCANCGRTLDATEGNALYYYSLPEAEQAIAGDATGTDAITAEDVDGAGSDTDAESAGSGENTPDPKTGLWVVISVVALVAIVAEATVLVRSLHKKKVER